MAKWPKANRYNNIGSENAQNMSSAITPNTYTNNPEGESLFICDMPQLSIYLLLSK